MDVVVDLASAADDQGIRALVGRETLPGKIRLSFPREPDFSLGCRVTGDDHQIVVARAASSGEVVGVACRSVREVFIDGRAERIGYLGQLRVAERFRGRWLVSRGFALLEQIDQQDPVRGYLASIVDGSGEATGVLVSKRRRRFPRFRRVAAYRTLALPLRRLAPSLGWRSEIVGATRDQLPELVRFLRIEGARRQLFTAWTEAAIERLEALGLPLADVRIARRNGAIAGVIALWDQTRYKQAVVRGYSGWMKWLAPFLPRVGDEIRSAYVSLVCVRHDSAAVFDALLRDAYGRARSRGFRYLLVGLDARDPLLRAAQKYPHFSYPSQLYFGSWANGALHEQLDDRPAYVDIATL